MRFCWLIAQVLQADSLALYRANVKVLVPGAGLGRLAWEIVRAGFSCQANEFSLHMVSPANLSCRSVPALRESNLQLIASSFILNNCSTPSEFTLHPYLHSFSNIRSREDLLHPCLIPDVAPNDIAGGEAEFSFAAGDFLEVYGDAPGAFPPFASSE